MWWDLNLFQKYFWISSYEIKIKQKINKRVCSCRESSLLIKSDLILAFPERVPSPDIQIGNKIENDTPIYQKPKQGKTPKCMMYQVKTTDFWN